MTEQFLATCLGGDLKQMMALLAPDVTAWTDGGGKAKAALRPLRGACCLRSAMLAYCAKATPLRY